MDTPRGCSATPGWVHVRRPDDALAITSRDTFDAEENTTATIHAAQNIPRAAWMARWIQSSFSTSSP